MSDDFSHNSINETALQNFLQFYFSKKGRVSRKQYWLYYIVPSVIAPIIFILALYELIKYKGNGLDLNPKSESMILTGIIMVYACFHAFVAYAVHVKRCHDLGLDASAGFATDRRGFMYNFSRPTSIFGGPIIFWRMFFEKGTGKPNKFGPPSK